jgi:hypothetical protein
MAICRSIVGSYADPLWAINNRMTVAADEAQNEGGTPQHVGHRADVEAGQARVAGQVIEHGHSSSLHDAVWGQVNGLKRAEIHHGQLLLRTTVHRCLEAYRTQGAVEEELRARIPHQAATRQVEIGFDVELFHQIRIVGVWREYESVRLCSPAHDKKSQMISHVISW